MCRVFEFRFPLLRLLLLAAVCATPLAGCGGGGEGVPVNGSVTYRGQPFSNASITFYPTSGRVAGAAIDNGQYSLRLLPGQYKVTVSLGVNLPPGWKEGDPIPPREIVLPDQFSNVLRTELTATILENQSEPIDFELP
jgi:hypothetical protein